MFDYSGILYRIWGVCGIILLLGILDVAYQMLAKKCFSLKKCKFGLIMIALAVCLGLIYASRIVFPNVSSYTGVFVEKNRNSRVAPPLPVTYQYVFWNGEGQREVVYLDGFSKDKIMPFEFECGCEYTVYYDKFTKVIVKVETIG